MNQCRLCDSENFAPYAEVGVWQYVRCVDCGLVQLAKALSDNEYNEIYDDPYFERGKYVADRSGELEQQRRVELLEKAGLKRGARVLDAGCATGDFLIAAKEKFEVWGLDLSDFAIKQAKQLNPDIKDQIFCGTLEDELSIPSHFDAIVLWDVVEHLRQPRAVIRQLTNRLTPDGVLFLSTPNIGALVAKSMRAKWAFMTPPEHICLFDDATLGKLVGTSEYAIEDWRSLGKWVNVGFLIHKLRRQFPKWVPAWLENASKGMTAMIYVPTGDIQYATCRRRAQ